MVSPILQFIEVSKDGKILTLKDGTSIYNAGTNPGGYGAPNANAPSLIGMSIRLWSDEDPYGSFVSTNSDLINALLNAGANLTADLFGGTANTVFAPGVHHVKYYPFESKDATVSLTNSSLTATFVSGADTPDTWNANYKGIVFQDPDDNSYSELYLIDSSVAATSGGFTLASKFNGITKSGYIVYLATEADLKVLSIVPAKSCVTSRIGKLGEACGCNTEEEKQLIEMVMQIFASEIDFDCLNYTGAHNKIVGVYLQCSDCKIQCSCS